MKSTKNNEGVFSSLKEQLLQNIGERIESIPIDSRGCWGILPYEPELPEDVIQATVQSQG